jgi:hypothetical protein
MYNSDEEPIKKMETSQEFPTALKKIIPSRDTPKSPLLPKSPVVRPPKPPVERPLKSPAERPHLEPLKTRKKKAQPPKRSSVHSGKVTEKTYGRPCMEQTEGTVTAKSVSGSMISVSCMYM